MEPTAAIVSLSNFAGDRIRFHQTNQRATKCAECGAKLESAQGVRRSVRNPYKQASLPKSGFLCHLCAGAALLEWAKGAPDASAKGFYSWSDFSAELLPFDGARASFAIPAQELAQAWSDHGSSGLRFAAEQLKAQARVDFLTKYGIPVSKEQINLGVMA